MANENLPRRLTVVLYADVADYSRLTGEDEDGTHRQLSEYLNLIAELVDGHRGRIMHYAGDAVLATFDAATDALGCAAGVQTRLAERNAPLPDTRRVQFRIGINLGDVIEDRSDVYGDGVNIAARLEAIAPPGGICVSQSVRDAVGTSAPGHFIAMGPQRLKNIAEPVRAFVLDLRSGMTSTSRRRIALEDQAQVRYCTAVDGISIAHTVVGSGYPMAVAGAWMTHLEREWDDPAWGNYLSGLAEDFQLIRYDQRGNGMSDWEDVDITFERMVDDLETVVDLAGHDQVAVWGNSQGAAVAAAYAARRPTRVSHLILYGGYARGRRRRGSPEAAAESEALVTLIRQSWGRDNPAIRQTMTSLFMPDATAEEATWFNNFQKACGPAENIARFREVFDDIDVTDLLGKITCPTLVVHCVGDSIAPLSEGRLLAARIAGAEFVGLETDSHMMTERDPEFPRMLAAVRHFMAPVTGKCAD
jgi:class 3 adenylate cyclase/pimeloyl-ACP methyl ester carboxylesterase